MSTSDYYQDYIDIYNGYNVVTLLTYFCRIVRNPEFARRVVEGSVQVVRFDEDLGLTPEQVGSVYCAVDHCFCFLRLKQ